MPPRINTAGINASEFSSYGFRGDFIERISKALGINTVPDKTRDMIKELTPNFVKNWRDRFFSFFTGSKTEK